MTETEFIDKEYQLIEDIKKSELYKKYKALSKEIENDKQLLSLAKERDDILKIADSEKDSTKKKELLLQFAQKEKEIDSVPLMQEYKEAYQAVRKLINHLTNGLNKEIL